MKFCQNCGNELVGDAKFCASCGKAVTVNSEDVINQHDVTETFIDLASEENNITDTVEIEEPIAAVTGKKKLVITKQMIIIASAVLMAIIVIGVIISNSISLNKYKEKLENAYDNITYGAQQAESYATLESKVWYNSIQENSSTETDKYTKNEYGRFYSDFNDALSSFYDGESLTYSIISMNTTTVDNNMSELKDCPKKFEDEYRALKELYVAYSDLTDLVVGTSSYSYNSFSDALNDAKSNYKTALSSAKLLIE